RRRAADFLLREETFTPAHRASHLCASAGGSRVAGHAGDSPVSGRRLLGRVLLIGQAVQRTEVLADGHYAELLLDGLGQSIHDHLPSFGALTHPSGPRTAGARCAGASSTEVVPAHGTLLGQGA